LRVDGTRSNPHFKVVSQLIPFNLIKKSTMSASLWVHEVIQTTILGLLGGLTSWAFLANTVVTGERLTSLMFQLQMTGYILKIAEYCTSLS
jgi:hypothetical protein